MGKKRIVVVSDVEEKKKEVIKSPRKGVDTSETPVSNELVTEPEKETVVVSKPTPSSSKLKPKKVKGKKYLFAKTKIDPHKVYPLDEAIKLVKETSFANFDATAEAHLMTNRSPLQAEIFLPYFQAKSKRVEIATDETISKIEAGKIDFDILMATPSFMPKLVKFAKILGPKGLMPNPKNGTIAESPQDKVKDFEKPALVLKTEQNAPLIHTVFGKVSQKEEELKENLQKIIQTIGLRNLNRIVIKASMGPAIRVVIQNPPQTV